MLRKLALAGASGALAYFVVAALPVLDAVEDQDWDGGVVLLRSLAVGVAVAAGRGVIAYLTAFTESDAEHGANIVGKFK